MSPTISVFVLQISQRSDLVESASEHYFLRLVSVRHPFGEELNLGLGPRTRSSRWWRRHDGAADATNTVVNGGSVRLYVVITSKIKCLAHSVNISFREEWANVGLKARQFSHYAS
jgi:hypothetical protein